MEALIVWMLVFAGLAAGPLDGIVLPDTTGARQSLTPLRAKATVLYFSGTECPLGNLYLAEVKKLAEKWHGEKVRFLLINPNATESPAEIAKHAREFAVPFPVLLDSAQLLTDRLGATRTPEAFLFDTHGELRYRGRVDDRYGYAHRRNVSPRADLETAIMEVLSDQPVSIPQTDIVGCLISRNAPTVAAGSVTYARDVVHLFRDKCEACHREGMVAPFSLSSYEDATRWLGPIQEAVRAERMPPWHADPAHGKFANDRRLTEAEKTLLFRWIEAGAPRGDRSHEPQPRAYTQGWMVGEPDLVFSMPREVKVPASGVVPYKYFTTRTRFAEDVWISAAEIKPGNPTVVHHAIVFVRDPKEGMLDINRLIDGFLVSSAPSDLPLQLPPGIARKIPAGSELVWQVHYTPTGKEEVDRCQLGLVLYRDKQPPRGDQRTIAVSNSRLRIPAGEPNYEHHALHVFPEDVTLLSLCPHMHLRGKDFSIEAIFPNKTRQTLLVVKDFDPDWNTTYRLAQPLPVPKGTKIHCVAHYDNSKANPRNPDPSKEVLWGEQIWDEMMIGWIDYYTEQSDLAGRPLPANK